LPPAELPPAGEPPAEVPPALVPALPPEEALSGLPQALAKRHAHAAIVRDVSHRRGKLMLDSVVSASQRRLLIQVPQPSRRGSPFWRVQEHAVLSRRRAPRPDMLRLLENNADPAALRARRPLDTAGRTRSEGLRHPRHRRPR